LTLVVIAGLCVVSLVATACLPVRRREAEREASIRGKFA